MTSNTVAEEIQPHSADIIQFPRSFTITSQDPSEILANLAEMKVVSVEEVLGFVVPTFFETLMQAGFSIDDDQLNTLLVGVTRAIMYRHYNLHHPLSDFVTTHADELEKLLSSQNALNAALGIELEENGQPLLPAPDPQEE